MPANIITPPSSYAYSTPILYVDVYSSNRNSSGSITLTPGNSGLMRVVVDKSIRGDTNSGRFSFTLSPGGVNGVNDPISWTSILTQYSLCVIYGSRGGSNAILMVGLISSIKESQIWNNDSVRRTIEVQGLDFTLFFTTFAYYVLDYLGLINTLSGLFGPAGSAILGNNGVLQGDPADVGSNWFIDVFLGFPGASPPAVLQSTTVTYKSNNVPLFDIMTDWFEKYDTSAKTPIIIPVLTNFLISDGTFWDKFVQIFPFPFYELFINTVPHGYYSKAASPVIPIETSLPGFGTADIVAVARVNPLPTVDVTNAGTPFLRRDRWDGLNLYTLNPFSFIESEVEYNIDDIKNFYVISPMGPLTAPGGAPGNNLAPAIEQMGYMFDAGSISKYGFRSDVESIIWWVYPYGTITTGSSSTVGVSVPSVVQYQSFLYKVASYYEAVPNMLYGTVKIPMWVNVVVGNQFQYYPFKNAVPYTFYITGVTHEYNYGDKSFTTLKLERGLPSDIYSNNDPLLLQIHMGQAERVNGSIVPLTSGVGLKYATIFSNDFNNGFPGMGAYGATASISPPPNTNNNNDGAFQTAVTSVACSQNIDWRVLKALAMTESGPAMNNFGTHVDSSGNVYNIDSKGNSYYGIMQVNPNSAPPLYNDPTQLTNNPTYNIHAGTAIFCNMLNSPYNPTHSTRTALALYKGANPSLGFTDPAVHSPSSGPTNWGSVDAAMGWAFGMGVPQIT